MPLRPGLLLQIADDAEQFAGLRIAALLLAAPETMPRNRVLFRLPYLAGLRMSEACARLQPRQDGGQMAVFGKGGKTRLVLLGADAWRAGRRRRR